MFASDNIGTWPGLRARTHGASTALVQGDERVTYEELERRCAAVAGALCAQGIGPGDRVAVALKNRIEFVELLFAVTRIGAIFVPLNFRLSPGEVDYALRDSGARLVIAQNATAMPGAIAVESEAFQAWRDAEPAAPVQRRAGDPATIIYTSGSTGAPKGAVITHGNIAAAVFNYLADWDLRTDDSTIVVNPIFHVVLYILAVPLLFLGGKVVLVEDFDPGDTLRQAERERVTVWFAIPTSWQMLLDDPAFERTDLSSVRFIGSGGAACPQPLMERFARAGLPYRQGYGLTECTSSGTTMQPEDQATRPGSIGRPFFHTETKLAPDGELLLRGRSLAAGYWNKPAETAAAFDEDGWFHTGDIAGQDGDGFLWIIDRKKDLIISGGENIASIEVEQAAGTHPAVREVAVVGVPHEHWGETPVAVVALHDDATLDAEDLIAHCRERIAGYKCPTAVEIVHALPKTATGKVSKPALRQQLAAMWVEAET
jgi:fatty-acyl-CoA synthase